VGVFSQRAWVAAFALAGIALLATTPAATATQAATVCSGVAVTSADAESLAAIVAAPSQEDDVLPRPGQYHLTATVSPATGDSLIGSGSGPGGTELRGDTVLSGWFRRTVSSLTPVKCRDSR
jgi:hypothetical protein